MGALEIIELKQLEVDLHNLLNRIQDTTVTPAKAERLIEKIKQNYCNSMDITMDELEQSIPNLDLLLLHSLKQRSPMAITKGDLLTNMNEQDVIERLASIKQEKESWKRWLAFKEYLLSEKDHFIKNKDLFDVIDNDSDEILAHFDHPNSDVFQSKKGLIESGPQSGKTEFIAAVTHKAICMNYRIHIHTVHNSSEVRNQFQERNEEDIIGKMSNGNILKLGTFLRKFEADGFIVMKTERDCEGKPGDKGLDKCEGYNTLTENSLLFIIAKRETHVMNKLMKGLKNLPFYNPERNRIEKVAAVIANDESDFCLINNQKHNNKISKMNRKIRELVGMFDKKVVLSITATPFADVFIDPDDDDLFPDFIFSRKESLDYIGPTELIGLYTPEGVVKKELPLVKLMDDIDSDQDREKLRNIDFENGLNRSIIHALYSFIISGALKNMFGQQKKHHTMLVHPSTLTDVHKKFANPIRRKIKEWKKYAKANTLPQPFWDELYKLYKEDFVTTSREMLQIDIDRLNLNPENLPDEYIHSFSEKELKDSVINFILELEGVRVLNGEKNEKTQAIEVLNYSEYSKKNQALKVIVIAGLKASRGYTFEGITTTALVRDIKYADTILQAGRFFGYRPGYRTLVRVYMTKDIRNSMREAVWMLNQLKKQFLLMNKQGNSPREYGIIIHKVLKGTGVRPTNRTKSGVAIIKKEKDKKRFFETDMAAVILDDKINKKNFNSLTKFMKTLGLPNQDKSIVGNFCWLGVPTDTVVSFLKCLTISEYSRISGISNLEALIQRATREGHIDSFDVVFPLLNVKDMKGREFTKFPNLLGNRIFYSKRSGVIIHKDNNSIHYNLTAGRALSGSHVYYGLHQTDKEYLYDKYPLEKKGNYHSVDLVMECRGKRAQLVLYLVSPTNLSKDPEIKALNKEITQPPLIFHVNLPGVSYKPGIYNKIAIMNGLVSNGIDTNDYANLG